MKPRTVILTIEMETVETAKDLQEIARFRMRAYGRVSQVQANVIRPTKKRKSAKAKR